LRDDRSDALGFLFDLRFVEAEDGVAGGAEVKVPRVIGLEGDGAAVVEEGIGFDDEAVRPPEEVDLPAAEFDVGLGERKARAMLLNQGE